MKRILFLMCWILVFAGGLQAQNLYDYDYDASGNRIRRRVITLKTDSAPIFTEDRISPRGGP